MAGAAKDTAEHLASLEDGRAVWMDGARVEDPARIPPSATPSAPQPGFTAIRPTPPIWRR